MKTNKYIEIIASSKPALNAMSKKTQLSVRATLRKKYTRVEFTVVDTLEDLEALVAKRPDLVILGRRSIKLKPMVGSSVRLRLWITDYLTNNNVQFAGSGTDSLRLQLDKPVAKQCILDAGLRSAAYFISSIGEPTLGHSLSFPLFVKPTNRGHSKGIDEQSVVHTHEELHAKILSIHGSCKSDALVEEYLPGREFSVAVIEDSAHGHMAMPIEILSPTDENGYTFLSAAVKNADVEQVVSVAEGTLKVAINDLAIDVFKSLGASDYGRIDIRLDSQGAPCFIEANLTPGLSNHGYLARCFSINQHIDYDDMIFAIVGMGVKRSMSARLPDVADASVKSLDAIVPEFANILV